MNSKKSKTKPSANYPEGREVFLPIFDAEFEALMSPTSMDDPGFCLGCGEEAICLPSER